MENTAMRELLATFLSEWAEPTEVWYPEKVINRVERMLDKERQQIIDGINDVLAQDDPTYTAYPENRGEQYFNENYGQ